MQIFLQINSRIIFRGQIWERVSDLIDDESTYELVRTDSDYGFRISRNNLRDESSLESYEDDDDYEEDDPDERKSKDRRPKEAKRRRAHGPLSFARAIVSRR